MDAEDPNDDQQYHLQVASGDVRGPVLLPGDPERVSKIADVWDESTTVASHREYRTVRGAYEGVPLSCTSTGIGSPSAAIAVEELARVDVDTLIRVGSCGVIQPGIDVGDLIITTGAVRQEGTSKEYVRGEYPATADHEVVSALIAAAEELGYKYHTGVTCSTDSFYTGQSRPGVGGYERPDNEARLDELREAGVLNLEMETAAICTLAGIYGLRAGAVCTVYANRVTGAFQPTGERRAGEVASRAASILAEMDEQVEASGAEAWHAGLSTSR
jgi:uridine phosphorylase